MCEYGTCGSKSSSKDFRPFPRPMQVCSVWFVPSLLTLPVGLWDVAAARTRTDEAVRAMEKARMVRLCWLWLCWWWVWARSVSISRSRRKAGGTGKRTGTGAFPGTYRATCALHTRLWRGGGRSWLHRQHCTGNKAQQQQVEKVPLTPAYLCVPRCQFLVPPRPPRAIRSCSCFGTLSAGA